MADLSVQRRYRSAIGRFASGVTVVTATGPRGHAGMTTNAVSSLSLEPILLLVCFENTSRTLPIVRDTGRFAVNVLRGEDLDLSRVFASKMVPAEKFRSVTHNVEHGVPVLNSALAWFVCDLEELIERGDHTVGIGNVTRFGYDDGDDGEPLVFFRGGYTVLEHGAVGRRAGDAR
jgi:3-hydroxy-9,10-secoandrosta-1,3,5(10)-triene-9,17-dione monooxygenase reductase component